jgi:NAD(P)-dependent dehydrogenase (short-subunit alcohol dehydrogenase family)
MLIGVGCGLALARRRKLTKFSFQDRSVVITGGSRGLGLVIARHLALQGARLAILARDSNELSRAESQLRANGAVVLPVDCDVRNQQEVNKAISTIVARFGGVDVLINNAGMIQVGPVDHLSEKDFEDALAIHLYAPLYCTLAVLPHMRSAHQGRIVNIASIGGKIGFPHMVPYCTSKFALVGLSDSLRAELRHENIFVTTVCPGLTRTGSPRNALFKGQHRPEYAWFAVSGSLPILSVDAERTARQIVEGCRRGASQVVIGLHVRAAILFNELFPGATASLTSLTNCLLPSADESGSKAHRPGSESQSWLAPRWLSHLNEKAALRNNQA